MNHRPQVCPRVVKRHIGSYKPNPLAVLSQQRPNTFTKDRAH